MKPQIRLFAACALFSTWMILLFTGFVLGGWTHLLFALALYLFPWRSASRDDKG